MNKRPTSRLAGEKYQTKSALHEHVRQMFLIERLCSRFHLVATQLQSRHDHRETLRVADETDVYDLLHALLVLEHDDVKPITWTPSYATGPRTDFLLRFEQIVIQAKKTEGSFGTQALKEQLTIDIEKYRQHPGCQTLVCFVYDPETKIANPRSIENELSGERDGLTIRVIVAPKGA